VIPGITYDRTDSPINPTHGKAFSFTSKIEGGPLQGNVNSLTEIFTGKYFRPNYHHRNVIGFKAQLAQISGYGGKDAPPYNRFYMGGEYDVRGFEAYTISPFVAIPSLGATNVSYLDPTKIGSNGLPTLETISVPTLQFFPTRPGGDTEAIINSEYRIPIYQNYVGLTFFNDFGSDGILRKSQLSLDPSAVKTFQQQYPNPDFPNLTIGDNLHIISGTNFTPHASAGVELVIQLPIIQAPFRIYYAYNYARLKETIQGPTVLDVNKNPFPGAFSVDPIERQYLQRLGVYNTVIVPQLDQFLLSETEKLPAGLIEPKSTFRFTVSRTF
jgi:outer membrane protein insertion porin family